MDKEALRASDILQHYVSLSLPCHHQHKGQKAVLVFAQLTQLWKMSVFPEESAVELKETVVLRRRHEVSYHHFLKGIFRDRNNARGPKLFRALESWFWFTKERLHAIPQIFFFLVHKIQEVKWNLVLSVYRVLYAHGYHAAFFLPLCTFTCATWVVWWKTCISCQSSFWSVFLVININYALRASSLLFPYSSTPILIFGCDHRCFWGTNESILLWRRTISSKMYTCTQMCKGKHTILGVSQTPRNSSDR